MSEIIASIPHNSESNCVDEKEAVSSQYPKNFIPHRFTPEQARAARAKGIENQRRNKGIASGELGFNGQPLTAQSQDGYVSEQLREAREEIQRLKALARQMTAPADIERMSRAIKEWAEQERKLAGRPLPGALRPNSKRQSAPPTEPI